MEDTKLDIEDKNAVIQLLDDFKSLIGNIAKVESVLKAEETKMNNKQQDLLHEIELSELNAAELIKIASRLRKLRKERRKVKDKLEYIRTLRTFTDKYNNNFKTYVDITNIKKQLETLEKEQATRIYRPRVLDDLKIAEKFRNTKEPKVIQDEEANEEE